MPSWATDPIYMTVPSNGLSLVTIASPADPSDDEWNRMTRVACQIVGKKLGITLCNRELLCAAINAKMSATDMTAG